MPWKTEIDRLVHHLVLDAAPGGSRGRAARRACHRGPLRPRAGSHPRPTSTPVPSRRCSEAASKRKPCAPSSRSCPGLAGEGAERWRHLGRLDGASRGGHRERVRELMEDPLFEASLDHPEGRVALRAVGRHAAARRRGRAGLRPLPAPPRGGDRRRAAAATPSSSSRSRSAVPTAATRSRKRRSSASSAPRRSPRRPASTPAPAARSTASSAACTNSPAAARTRRRATAARSTVCPRTIPTAACSSATSRWPRWACAARSTCCPSPTASGREEAEEILETGQTGEGRSYNAIYTLGMLAYERGDYESGRRRAFREADQLMRENRAKARIVHARSRFFLGHCLLELGAEGEELDEAERAILKNASAVSLDPEIKGPVFDALVEHKPDARIPGRPAAAAAAVASAARPSAAQHLEAARERLERDPHEALTLVDRAFKSRPDFETWFGAYRTRLEALLALDERDEALRTFERFRAKLYQRDALEPLAAVPRGGGGPGIRAPRRRRLPRRARRPLRGACPSARSGSARSASRRRGQPGERRSAADRAVRGPCCARPPRTRPRRAGERLDAATERGEGRRGPRGRGAARRDPGAPEGGGGARPTGRRRRRQGAQHRHVERFQGLARSSASRATGSSRACVRPTRRSARSPGAAQDADVILLHHALGPDMRREVQALGEKYDVPVREAAWLGAGEPRVRGAARRSRTRSSTRRRGPTGTGVGRAPVPAGPTEAYPVRPCRPRTRTPSPTPPSSPIAPLGGRNVHAARRARLMERIGENAAAARHRHAGSQPQQRHGLPLPAEQRPLVPDRFRGARGGRAAPAGTPRAPVRDVRAQAGSRARDLGRLARGRRGRQGAPRLRRGLLDRRARTSSCRSCSRGARGSSTPWASTRPWTAT